MKNKEAELKLATAMGRLAEALERFQDPLTWQRVFKTAVESGMVLPQLPGSGPAPVVTVVGVKVTLSDEEREKMVARIHEAIQPQLDEFNTFVRESLAEMPPARLKGLAERIEQGETVALGRRRGCVYLTTGGEDYYLGL